MPSATTATTTVPAAVEEEEPEFYLMLMWHQHQPRYPLDADGVITRPWVRLHATKDYLDMAATVAEYPDVSAVFNLTPTLLMQLDELAGGVKDVYWTASEVPADDLSEAEKRFLLERFFDVDRRIISRFPRYQELLELRDSAGGATEAIDVFGSQDYRDLQVLFNLAWTDTDVLAREPLAGLVRRERDFVEAHKAVVFAEHMRIISEVVPLHAELWEQGQIEVTTSPFAHPILPLVADTSLAAVGDPTAIMPSEAFRQVLDADEQVVLGLDVAEEAFGRQPGGMWPGEGAVAQRIMSLFSKNGVEWVATGEQVLAPSLGIGSFTRTADDVVVESADLYRPWQATLSRNSPVPMFFRDSLLSDLVAFEYSGMPGAAAADDLMRRLRDIKDSIVAAGAYDPDRPPVVSVIVDGENPWENYPDDGKIFLRSLYSRLSQSTFVETITPGEYLERFAEPDALEDVHPGAWFQSNYATWIGEDEEAIAWDYLREVREDLARAEQSSAHTSDQLAGAREAMLLAEGSDWFWWYGSDQDSGDDAYFDRAFRALLAEVYTSLGLPSPAFVAVPIVPAPAASAAKAADDLMTPTIDFEAGSREWASAGRYDGGSGVVESAYYGYDTENLYLRVDFGEELLGNDDIGFEVYLGAPRAEAYRGTTIRETLLGFRASTMVEWIGAEPLQSCVYSTLPDLGDEDALADCSEAVTGFDGDSVEFAVPLAAVGAIESGDEIPFRVVPNDIFRDGLMFPGDGPGIAQVPDLSNVEVFLSVEDPVGDDHGPGTYTYPTDPVFAPGSYDIELFEVGTENDDVVFTFEIESGVQNPWGSPRGLSIQTFDIYIDVDREVDGGARLLLPGRNAALEPGSGWEIAITVEGWEPALYRADLDGAIEEETPSFDVIVFGEQGKIVVRIPRSLVADSDPTTWAYAAAVMSQEGFPSPGVRRVRDVGVTAEQYTAGGAPNDINHTRLFDLVAAGRDVQESALSEYPSVASGSIDDLDPDDFATIPLLVVEAAS